MVEELLDNTKFIVVPRELANQLRILTARLGYSVTDFTVEALTQAMRIQEMGSNLKEAVDLFYLTDIHRGAGNIQITRSVFKDILQKLIESDNGELNRIWYEHGKWYGEYLKVKLGKDQVFNFLEKDLLVSWNLDESEITQQDVMVSIRCVSFGMSAEFTELLVSYISGLMEEFGYLENDSDVLKGLISLKFLGKLS